jgi:hypothetical protein
MRRLILPLFLAPALLAQAPSAAEAKRADIKKRLGIMKAGELGVQSIAQSLPSMKQAAPSVPPIFWDEFQKEFTAQRMEDLVVPVYEEVLTADEVKAYLAFLSTPTGASFARKQPVLLQKCMEAGQKLGAEVAQQVAARLQSEGKL